MKPQFIDGVFHRGDDVDPIEEKHQGKNRESENNFPLHV